MTILEKKDFISSKYRQFVMPSSQSNNPLSNIRSVNVCSFFVPSIVEISYKGTKSFACETLAPSAVASRHNSNRASAHPRGAFLCHRKSQFPMT